jgi:hypothetical protein
MPRLYDKLRFSPAAPILETQITHPNKTSRKIKMEMQLDSGADMTCIPLVINEDIPNLRSGSVKVEDYNGIISIKRTRFILLVIGEQELLTEAIEVEGEIGLLGRDLLNKYRTILDGSKLEFDLEYFKNEYI